MLYENELFDSFRFADFYRPTAEGCREDQNLSNLKARTFKKLKFLFDFYKCGARAK